MAERIDYDHAGKYFIDIRNIDGAYWRGPGQGRRSECAFPVACTMIDAFSGAIPLLWRTTVSWRQSVLRLGVVLMGVFALNILRLELGFVAMDRGAPWWLAHECVAGVACLYIFKCVSARGIMHPIDLRRSVPGVFGATKLTTKSV